MINTKTSPDDTEAPRQQNDPMNSNSGFVFYDFRLIDTKEFARLLHSSIQTVRRIVNNREIAFYQPRRKILFKMDDVKAFLEACKTKACE
jgi:excisionase family DNA binding protein